MTYSGEIPDQRKSKWLLETEEVRILRTEDRKTFIDTVRNTISRTIGEVQTKERIE